MNADTQSFDASEKIKPLIELMKSLGVKHIGSVPKPTGGIFGAYKTYYDVLELKRRVKEAEASADIPSVIITVATAKPTEV